VLAVLLALVWQPILAFADDVRVVAVHTASAPRVSVIIATAAGPSQKSQPPDVVSVQVGNASVPVTVTPMASPGLSVAIVIDAASDVPADTLQAVQSGATDFLLSLPIGAKSMVISAGTEPRVVAPLSTEPVEALSAISALRPRGTRSVAAGVLLATESLTAAPAGPRAIIVFSNGTDEPGPIPADVADSISRASAAVSVIQTRENDFWDDVLQRSGGHVLITSPRDVVQSFRRASAAMSNQYVIAFDTPTPLPRPAEIVVRTGDVESTTVVQLPRAGESGAAAAADGREPAKTDTEVVLLSGMAAGLLLAVLAVIALIRRRRQSLPSRHLAEAGPGIGTHVPRPAASRSEMTSRRPEQTQGVPSTTVITAPTSLLRGATATASSDAPDALRKADTDLRSQRQNATHQRAEDRHASQAGQPSDDQVLPTERRVDAQSPREQTLAARDVVTGAGPAVVQLEKNLSGLTVVHISGNAESRYFGVRTVQTRRNLVNTTEPYDGVRLLDRDGDRSTALQVQAIGRWMIEVQALEDVPSFEKSYTGDGDAVVRYTGQGSTIQIAGNDAGEYFGVRCITAHGAVRLVNTARPYSSTHVLSANPQVFEIRAVGSWTLAVI
jgi:hypothetical protein